MLRRILITAGLALSAAPAAAATLTASVSHNCCPQCDRAIVSTGTKIPGVAEFKTDRANLTVSLKSDPTGPLNVIPVISAFRQGGFPLQNIKVQGVKTVEFSAGHLCCGGCVSPLRTALASLKTLTPTQLAPNKPVKLNVQGGTLDVTELLKALDAAGYSATTLMVQ
jgi:periplasmic mercuric ion binding protein